MFVVESAVKELYQQFVENGSRRDFRAAIINLHDIFAQIPYHPSYIFHFLGDNVAPRERLTLINLYKRTYPESPIGYLLDMWLHFEGGRPDNMRQAWRELCENADKGFHLQPAIIASVFEAELGVPHTSVAVLGMGAKLVRGFDGLKTAQSLRAPALPADTPGKDLPRRVLTEPAEPIGLTGVALNGRLSGFTKPTRYYFRYGFDSENLTDATPPRYMPAGLYGRVRDGGENAFHRITAYAATVGFDKVDLPDDIHAGNEQALPMPEHAMQPAMKLEWPFGKDRNHLNGIGVIDLLLGWKTQAQTTGTVIGGESPTAVLAQPTAGEGIDLRDAVVSVTYRSRTLDAKAFSPVVWIHGRAGAPVSPDQPDILAAWAVTNNGAPKSFGADGNWHRLAFSLPGQSSNWTFCGSNTEEMGSAMERYAYAPIQQIQRDNTGGNVCLAFVHGSDLDTPEGEIEIAELEMRYRSRSLLGPGQQACLQSMPDSGAGDPAHLTDGSLGDVEHFWSAAVSPVAPCDLIWCLRDQAGLEAVKIHQNPLAPAKDLDIAVSNDGIDFKEVWSGSLEDVPENPVAWGPFARKGKLIHLIKMPRETRAQYIRLRVKSGYRPGLAGLDAFEVFGQGLPFIPSADDHTFSEDIENLEPGTPIYAQLVAENDDGVIEGDIVEVRRPLTAVPSILSVKSFARQGDTARIVLRTIAMGAPAILNISLTSDDGREIKVPPVSIGKWAAARDSMVSVAGLKPGVSYQGLCRAENEHGVSEDVAFECGANG
jgi:hypothetical protein